MLQRRLISLGVHKQQEDHRLAHLFSTSLDHLQPCMARSKQSPELKDVTEKLQGSDGARRTIA